MEDEEGDKGVQQVDFIFLQHDIVVQPAVAQENQGSQSDKITNKRYNLN